MGNSSRVTMAMLRVSSYRKLFEEKQRPALWPGMLCGAQLRHSSTRGGVSMTECPEPDFAASRTLNRQAAMSFSQERTIIAALNDRLVAFINMARCLEEENAFLEAQIIEMEDSQAGKLSFSTSLKRPLDNGLEAVIETLRREKEEILCDIAELKKHLQHIQIKCHEVREQQTLLQKEREDIAVDVDAVTADCLALREQVAVYEGQLAVMEQEHELRIESLCEPAAEDKHVLTASLQFPSIDVTPAVMAIKEYYCQLAESLQFKSRAVVVADQDEKVRQVGQTAGEKMKNNSEVMDVKALKELIGDLHTNRAELEKHGDELEAETEAKRDAFLLEIEELESCICRMEEEEADLQAQMKAQMGDYEELLNEKMALDIEIAAYRVLVEKEEERLCSL